MNFLENLEVIEGRERYYDKYALSVGGNYHLTSLGLKSLRKISNGAIAFRQNRNLCYGRGIPFKEKYKTKEVTWRGNMPNETCRKI